MANQKLPRKVGQKAENQAKQLLLDKGYTFITQNFSSKYGEIDLIFLDGDQLVFVEVKARKPDNRVSALESITPQKLRNIRTTAEIFMQSHPQLSSYGRIDAVTIELDSQKIEHHTDIG